MAINKFTHSGRQCCVSLAHHRHRLLVHGIEGCLVLQAFVLLLLVVEEHPLPLLFFAKRVNNVA